MPAGYTLRTYRDGDAAAYVELMHGAGFETWTEAKAQRVFETMLPDGLFFIVHNATGALVATAAAQVRPREHHPLGGELGWVGTDCDHRGKGLGTIVCAAVTRRLLASDCATFYLLTDDLRLPAISVYLKLGWIPFLYLPEFEARWQAVCAGLGISYDSVETTTDPAG
jgi:mycothiol synthase